jgi:hypothetical protein
MAFLWAQPTRAATGTRWGIDHSRTAGFPSLVAAAFFSRSVLKVIEAQLLRRRNAAQYPLLTVGGDFAYPKEPDLIEENE